MNYKLFGAAFVIVACGGWGFLVASQYLLKLRLLKQLISALEFMECELQYRCTSLPALCRQAGEQSSGKVRLLFLTLCEELESQVCPNVEQCMRCALEKCGDISVEFRKLCSDLGRNLGKFSLEGQLQGLNAAKMECRQLLGQLQTNHEARVRSYQTLGLCAGAALAILFI